MSSCQTPLRPLLRLFAVMTLVAWIGAHALCQAHCWSSACHDESGGASCRAEKSSGAHHGDENTPGHQDGSANISCDTLKSALSSHALSPLVIPEFSLLDTLAPTVLALDETALESAALISRRADRRERMSEPVVYLGPAFRSLAPPVLL